MHISYGGNKHIILYDQIVACWKNKQEEFCYICSDTAIDNVPPDMITNQPILLFVNDSKFSAI